MAFTGNRKETNFGFPKMGPVPYTSLSREDLSYHIARMANGKKHGETCDTVWFQPCQKEEQRSQDRYVIEDWELSDGVWKFRAIFDGHGGHEAVDYTSTTLPGIIKASLQAAIQDGPLPTEGVSELLKSTIKAFDNSIATDLYAIHPAFATPETLSKLSDDQIQHIINDGDLRTGKPDPHNGLKAENIQKVLRCMRGTTALVTLIDPGDKNLWVASLGDCLATLCSRPKGSSETFHVQNLSVNHNASNPAEQERIRSEHPANEHDTCVMKNGRVLGAIAISRALGDMAFKLPAEYTRKVFLNAMPGFQVHSSVFAFTERNKTPPYVGNEPDVVHTSLSDSGAEMERFLILCSDGLTDLYDPRFAAPSPSSSSSTTESSTPEPDFDPMHNATVDDWDSHMTKVGRLWCHIITNPDNPASVSEDEKKNAALRVLLYTVARGCGADAPYIPDIAKGDSIEELNLELASRALTLEKTDKWMDDITVVVQSL